MKITGGKGMVRRPSGQGWPARGETDSLNDPWKVSVAPPKLVDKVPTSNPH
jgi:hypothetical protein